MFQEWLHSERELLDLCCPHLLAPHTCTWHRHDEKWLPKGGWGGLTNAKICWWFWQIIQRPKVLTFPKGNQLPWICKYFPRNYFDPTRYVNLRQNVPQSAWEVKSYKPKSMTLFSFWGFPYHNPQQLMKMQFIITMRADPPEPRPAWRRQVSLEFKQLFGQLLVLRKL